MVQGAQQSLQRQRQQYNLVQLNTVHLYSTLEYSTIQYSTVQYSTVQYRTFYSREEEFQHLPDHAVAEQRGLVGLADGPQQAALAVHPEVEQEVFNILKYYIHMSYIR